MGQTCALQKVSMLRLSFQLVVSVWWCTQSVLSFTNDIVFVHGKEEKKEQEQPFFLSFPHHHHQAHYLA